MASLYRILRDLQCLGTPFTNRWPNGSVSLTYGRTGRMSSARWPNRSVNI